MQRIAVSPVTCCPVSQKPEIGFVLQIGPGGLSAPAGTAQIGFVLQPCNLVPPHSPPALPSSAPALRENSPGYNRISDNNLAIRPWQK
jgi:hypothetical protein